MSDNTASILEQMCMDLYTPSIHRIYTVESSGSRFIGDLVDINERENSGMSDDELKHINMFYLASLMLEDEAGCTSRSCRIMGHTMISTVAKWRVDIVQVNTTLWITLSLFAPLHECDSRRIKELCDVSPWHRHCFRTGCTAHH